MTEKNESMTPAVRKTITDAVKVAKGASENTRFLQAVATGLVFEHKAIGEGGLYRTQGDYAAAVGCSNGNVTGLRNLSVAVRLGATPADAGWAALSSNAQTALIADVANGKRPTLPKFYAAAKKAAAAKSADAAKRKAGATPTPRKGAAEKAAEKKAADAKKAADEASTLTPLQRVQAAVLLLSVEAKNLSDEEWAEVGTSLAGIVKREHTIRSKKATPRKTA